MNFITQDGQLCLAQELPGLLYAVGNVAEHGGQCQGGASDAVRDKLNQNTGEM
ncbi:hypothetical protein BFV94_4314 [Alteromonas macleodii]|uniref:Uncharacterized protein n=1 Tax=Alteromonas macleodii TaxID=28108 RepID=A0AB36FLI8_ALTMA|nr:hypothetical protein BFV93_4702 [Alteromonas macleodii]OES25788.1 hypothetical protein BFV94_4314 [Alteromonas macleodii]OES25869.1 hypothetical protein BFV95_4257 [Alteromonas macleodii]